MTDHPNRAATVDDWDQHWEDFGRPAQTNPANRYRSRLIFDHLGDVPAGARILDIGSGQGQLALALGSSFPTAEIWGIEYSDEGVRRAGQAAKARRLSARFTQRDLLQAAVLPDSDRGWATHAVCSEVLEHVDRPEVLLRQARDYLAPGCLVVITVPGGPRSAFDRHIGHRQHFTPETLRRVLVAAGYEVKSIERAGFPFFNLYRLSVIARGKRLMADLKNLAEPAPPSSSTEEGHAGSGHGVMQFVLRAFDVAFRYNLPSSPLGWQVVATARV